MKTLRLILGDQLNLQHSWFEKADPEVCYLMAEMRQETDYVTHHLQKVLGFFGAMRAFAQALEERGHRVRYLRISDPDNPQNLPELLDQVLEAEGAGSLEYLEPDEYRLDRMLADYAEAASVPCRMVSSEHFYTSRSELAGFFGGKKQYLMESFYRMMRQKHGILLEGGQPEGGQWNFDSQNRKKWKGDPPPPPALEWEQDLSPLEAELRDAGIDTLGKGRAEAFPWPLTRAQSLELLEYFCTRLLPLFGDYQDAMHTGVPYLFHSRLSFALNTKMLSPAETVEAALAAYRERPGEIHISQVEGFVRQILGWREYMRGMYWQQMPAYEHQNQLENYGALPEFYWTGDTRMRCLASAIGQSLELAYAHHIQRLMITGNFALLLRTDPALVDQWYLGIYIDAIQWVELPNTRGMSQFADGGLLATKPYISSANYIHKMSNYCETCAYNHKKRTGPDACPFNALYWDFLEDKREQLASNPRMGMMYRLLDKIPADEMQAIRERAGEVRSNPDAF
ncbi:cryptochrome/photolyase family protein [Robiginitalea sp. M366]|uniref:cryptochrome/photolyase family protein n=1 Tax=Robiginitalea aestuariiviva TaxID=3036903 RepID=UPI00240DA12A|nr:cryptochrome/photolyase family protein [Robiginitalea aestuariiviva]MDG1570772.1 cryptochrome/photolyase family protein [Robiginitalea aestuariiviva]